MMSDFEVEFLGCEGLDQDCARFEDFPFVLIFKYLKNRLESFAQIFDSS